MHILITSWKDIQNPQAGGAEILTHEIAKRAVKKNHKVTILSGLFPKGKNQEIFEGIEIIRPTYFHPTTPKGYFRLPIFLLKVALSIKKLEKNTDIIIDQVHGLPFFTPLFVNKPIIMFPLEVADDIWLKEIPFPGNILGWLIERLYLQLFRKLPFLTISPSTAKDLKRFKIENIKVIKPGVTSPTSKLPQKNSNPTFICLGRLTKMKRLDHSIEAFSKIAKLHPKCRLHIVGKGMHKKELQNLTKNLGLQESVIFHGFISDQRKYELLSQSWALLSTSLREGWGLNVIEAASVGTPTIAYCIPGIVDTVIDKKTGLLTPENQPHALAKLIDKLIKDKKLRSNLNAQAKKHAQQFTWEKTTNQFLAAINKTLKSKS